MDWTRGYSAEWRIFEVNRDTWADASLVEGVRSVKIERDCGSDAPLLESGSISIDSAEPFEEKYLRVTMTTVQDGISERFDIGTFLCTQTSGESDRGNDEQDIMARSVLYPASVRKLVRGSYAPMGTDGAQWAADMLASCCAAPVGFTGGFTLASNIVFDIGTSYLEAVWSILDAGGYCIRLGGDGSISVEPLPTDPELLLDDAGARLLMPSIKYDLDYSKVPNRYTAVEGMQTAQVTNDDPNSIVSTVRRGYYHDIVDKSPKRVNGETLAAYAARKLEEASVISDTRTYTREYSPGVRPFSVVRGSLESVSIEGSLRVIKQSLKCGKGITVTERAERGVALWQR